MQSSRGPPPHGSMPSPTGRTNAQIPAPGSFNTSDSIPPPPHLSAMNPLTDQRLTGSVMPYQPIDHHPLSRYAHPLHPTRHCIAAVDHPISCHTHISTPIYQHIVPWRYASSWDTTVPVRAPPSPPVGNIPAQHHTSSLTMTSRHSTLLSQMICSSMTTQLLSRHPMFRNKLFVSQSL
jgi:hypothetical protein